MSSIQRRITWSTIVWVAVILTLGHLLVALVVSSWQLQRFDDALQAKARALVTLTEFDGNNVELEFADEFMPEFEAKQNPEYFELFLASGELVERSRSFGEGVVSSFSNQETEVEIHDNLLPDGRHGRSISIKFTTRVDDNAPRELQEQETMPLAILRYSRERESLDRDLLEFYALDTAVSLLLLFSITFSISRSIRSGLQPLIRMRNDISQIGPDSIDKRIHSEGQPSELQPIATQFNLVLSEIEKAIIREREFSSDVAHELRTPVAEIRSLAEVGMRWPDEKDIRSYFADIHDSSRHLDRLIENLLLLCRNESHHIELELGSVNPNLLLNKVCANFTIDIADKNITLLPPETDLPMLISDASLLEHLLSNLIFNAISHSPEECSIHIKHSEGQGYCEIEITNPMREQLSEADMGMIFKKFWRKDSAREIGHHAGIGLALAQSYANCMDLRLQASITDSGLFSIRLGNLKIA